MWIGTAITNRLDPLISSIRRQCAMPPHLHSLQPPPKGGCLLTMDSVWLSWLHHGIVSTGIFSCLHLTLVWLMRPVFTSLLDDTYPFMWKSSTISSCMPAAGAPRTSYAIRLVQGTCMTRASIESSIRRSNVCTVLNPSTNKWSTRTRSHGREYRWNRFDVAHRLPCNGSQIR